MTFSFSVPVTGQQTVFPVETDPTPIAPLPTRSEVRQFTVTNPTQVEKMLSLTARLEGPQASKYTVSVNPTITVPAGGMSTGNFTVRVAEGAQILPQDAALVVVEAV